VKRLGLRKSRAGALAAGLFVAAFFIVFAFVWFVASRNPADSGESGLLLLIFAMPWAMWLPVEWLGPWAGAGCMLLNAFLLYCLFGGIGLRRPG